MNYIHKACPFGPGYAHLTAAVQEYQELLMDDNASGSRRLQTLRDLIDVKKMGG